jgi:hypothetical protein
MKTKHSLLHWIQGQLLETSRNKSWCHETTEGKECPEGGIECHGIE